MKAFFHVFHVLWIETLTLAVTEETKGFICLTYMNCLILVFLLLVMENTLVIMTNLTNPETLQQMGGLYDDM